MLADKPRHLRLLGTRVRAMVGVRRFVLAVGVALILWLAIHTVAITYLGLRDDLHPADVVVILGNKVERTGLPSPRLQERLDRGLALYRQGLAPKVIVSGGVGREGYAEAEVMRDYLLARGVAAADVIVDNDGVDTYHTAASARQIMAVQGMRSAIVVSQYYHIPRTRLAFQRLGIGEVYGAHAAVRVTWREPYNLLREFAAFYWYLVRPYG